MPTTKKITKKQVDFLFREIAKTQRLVTSLGIDAVITRDTRMLSRRSAARHEAAHAVVALALGGSVWMLLLCKTPVPRMPRDGVTAFTFTADSYEAQRVTGVAGMCGSRQLSMSDFQVFFNAWGNDTRQRMRLTAADAFSRAVTKADALLMEHHRAHAALTDALMEADQLDAKTIRKIVRRVEPKLAARRPTKREALWWASQQPMIAACLAMQGEASSAPGSSASSS